MLRLAEAANRSKDKGENEDSILLFVVGYLVSRRPINSKERPILQNNTYPKERKRLQQLRVHRIHVAK